ncbi:hypothetical protein [Variovorax sp. LT2P21]|uniref:hypothetical protein n=1 Tax=Variovorax sp. LT2P21 TaxID=3443731 RepID=UPI003F49AE1D
MKNWNTASLIKDAQAQTQITQEFGQRASAEVGAYANKKIEEANVLYAQAAAETDPQKKAALYASSHPFRSGCR